MNLTDRELYVVLIGLENLKLQEEYKLKEYEENWMPKKVKEGIKYKIKEIDEIKEKLKQ